VREGVGEEGPSCLSLDGSKIGNKIVLGHLSINRFLTGSQGRVCFSTHVRIISHKTCVSKNTFLLSRLAFIDSSVCLICIHFPSTSTNRTPLSFFPLYKSLNFLCLVAKRRKPLRQCFRANNSGERYGGARVLLPPRFTVPPQYLRERNGPFGLGLRFSTPGTFQLGQFSF
jgi:hypothetical protein